MKKSREGRGGGRRKERRVVGRGEGKRDDQGERAKRRIGVEKRVGRGK